MTLPKSGNDRYKGPEVSPAPGMGASLKGGKEQNYVNIKHIFIYTYLKNIAAGLKCNSGSDPPSAYSIRLGQ